MKAIMMIPTGRGFMFIPTDGGYGGGGPIEPWLAWTMVGIIAIIIIAAIYIDYKIGR